MQALFVDPAAEPSFTELTGERRPFSEVAHQAKLEQVAATFQPEVDRLRRLVDAPDLEPALAALLVYRTYVEPGAGLVDEPRPRGGGTAARAGPPDSHARAGGSRRVRDALPADDGLGDGQGCRGHRLLPLRPPARAERGGRRSRTVRDRRRRPSTRRTSSEPAVSRTRCSPARRTTRSAARTFARASGRCRTSPSAGPRTCAALARAESAASPRCRPRLDRGAADLPDPPRRLAA